MKLNRSANMLINWTEYDYLQNDRWRISKITQKKLFLKVAIKWICFSLRPLLGCSRLL